MGRKLSKSHLPEKKFALYVNSPLLGEKKWQDCWDDVKYCSERCRRRRSQTT